MREGKKLEGGGFKAPPPDRIGLNYLMYCTHYIPSVLICICTINKDYYYITIYYFMYVFKVIISLS